MFEAITPPFNKQLPQLFDAPDNRLDALAKLRQPNN
jgi:hypothetical protein